MKASMLYLIAFAITALGAASGRSTQHEDQQLNDLLWLKRLFGIPMVLLGAAYGYWTYLVWNGDVAGDLINSFTRAAGWLFWGSGLASRIVVSDASTLERVHKGWMNQQRAFRLWLGFLIILGHTGYVVFQQGPSALRADAEFMRQFVAVLAHG